MAQGHYKENAAVKKIACVGIMVADVMTDPIEAFPEPGKLVKIGAVTLHNGGNAMTAAINLKKMGVDAKMVGKLGNDMFGYYLRDCLDKAGVDTKGLRTDDKVQTSVSVVLLDATGERSFLHCTGTNAVLSVNDIDWEVISETDGVFVTGSFLMDNFDGDETAAFLKKCKDMGKTTFLDVCWDASGRWGDVLNCCMPYIDYFMPSIDEAVQIASCKEPDEIADVFMSRGVKNVVIKLGKKGAYLRLNGEEKGRIFPAVGNVKRIDTTGAGDSFCSGFLAAFARDKDAEFCVKFANTVGALCVTAKGATAGTKTYEETIEIMKEWRAI